MLSPTARFAAILTMAQAGLVLTSPASASPVLDECGEEGQHWCCGPNWGVCEEDWEFCCEYDGEGGRTDESCMCKPPDVNG